MDDGPLRGREPAVSVGDRDAVVEAERGRDGKGGLNLKHTEKMSGFFTVERVYLYKPMLYIQN